MPRVGSTCNSSTTKAQDRAPRDVGIRHHARSPSLALSTDSRKVSPRLCEPRQVIIVARYPYEWELPRTGLAARFPRPGTSARGRSARRGSLHRRESVARRVGSVSSGLPALVREVGQMIDRPLRALGAHGGLLHNRVPTTVARKAGSYKACKLSSLLRSISLLYGSMPTWVGRSSTMNSKVDSPVCTRCFSSIRT